jgi:uncharacterized protein with PQ loop repeat
MTVEAIGWIAGFLFAFCGAPQAYKSYKEGHSDGISWIFIGMWLVGEILMQIYVILKHGFDMPLLVNYWVNTIFSAIILYYKIKPREENENNNLR